MQEQASSARDAFSDKLTSRTPNVRPESSAAAAFAMPAITQFGLPRPSVASFSARRLPGLDSLNPSDLPFPLTCCFLPAASGLKNRTLFLRGEPWQRQTSTTPPPFPLPPRREQAAFRSTALPNKSLTTATFPPSEPKAIRSGGSFSARCCQLRRSPTSKGTESVEPVSTNQDNINVPMGKEAFGRDATGTSRAAASCPSPLR